MNDDLNDDTNDRLAWTSWPARERPTAAAVGGAVIVLLGVAGAIAGKHWLVGAGCSIALLLALHRFYFPVRCEVGAGRATVRSLLATRSISLSGVRRISHDNRIAVLSCRAVGGAIGSRDLVLPLPMTGNDATVQALRDRVGRERGGISHG